jgi:hypothetical protein
MPQIAADRAAVSARVHMVSDEIQVLRTVVARLESAAIEYMLTGSVAMAWYAQPRQTRDIDLVVELPESKVDLIVKAFSPDFYLDPETVRVEVRRRGMFNMIEETLVMKVDMILRRPDAHGTVAFKRRRQIELVAGFSLYIISPEDLILAKLRWAAEGESELQLRDVRNLVGAVEDLDRAYLGEWVSQLGFDSLLEKVTSS